MSCPQDDLPKTLTTIQGTPVGVDYACPAGTRRLMVSDAPERLDARSLKDGDGLPLAHATLWHDYVHTWSSSQSHRVFLWHENKTGIRVKLGLTLQNLSPANTLQITRGKQETCYEPRDYLGAGMCLAKACAGDTMEWLTPVDPVIGPDTLGIISQTTFETNLLMGAIYEFDIAKLSGPGQLHYKLRTVVSKQVDRDLRTLRDAPIHNEGPHPRGSWPYSEIEAAIPPYMAGQTAFYNVSMAGSPDQLFRKENSYDPDHAVTNRGHFGATYTLTIPLANPTCVPQGGQISLTPRGNNPYAGAGACAFAGFFPGIEKKVAGIPVLRPSPTATKEIAILGTFTLPPYFSAPCKIRLMHAGGATMPVAVYISSAAPGCPVLSPKRLPQA